MKVITPFDVVSNTQFSRASTKTYVDVNGIVQTAAIDVPAVNYNYATSTYEGISIESATTNLLLRSEDLSNASWVKSNATISADAITSPSGTLTADKMVEGATNTAHYLTQTITVNNATIYTLSFYAKYGEVRYLETILLASAFGSNIADRFDLVNGVVVLNSTGNANIEALPDGWFRCSTSKVTTSALTGPPFQIRTMNATGTNSAYSGDGISGFYLWGMQFAPESLPSSYIPTIATTVTRSADVLGDMLTTTVNEPDAGESLWNAATNYSVNDVVIRTTTHKKYINIQAGVNATLPEVDAALPTPTRWVETGSTNRYAMFDTIRNTQTITTSPLSVVIKAGTRINSIGILGSEADAVNIKIVSDGVEVYNYDENLNTRVVNNWLDYFFEDFSSKPATVRFDLPPYSQGEIYVTLSSRTSTVKCGALVIGNYTDIGKLEYGARISGTNFSRIDREFDGTAILIQRQTKPRVNGRLMFDKMVTNKVLALKTSLNATPAVWSGLDDDNSDEYFDGLLILGIYKVFDVDVAYPQNAMLEIEIEEI